MTCFASTRARSEPPRPRRLRPGAEDGGLIIEVIVSALLVGLMAIGIFSALDAASARTGAIKSRAIAANVAQADLERLRAMAVSDVSNRRDTYFKVVDGIQFTVNSRADWVTDSSGSASCSSSSAKADYLKISSKVSWPAMGGLKPVVLTSVIAPPTGSFAADQGSLAVKVADAAGNPVVGKTVTLSGLAGFTETTNDLGCVLWGFLTASVTAGDYTVTLGGGCSDHAGNDPVTSLASVTGATINTISLDCDVPGAIAAVGDTVPLNLSGTPQAAKASPLRYLSVANSGLPAPSWKAFGNGSTVASISATSLFPFTDPYAAYAGNCANQDPRTLPNAGSVVFQTAPKGGTAGPVTVRQPALNLDVEDRGSGSGTAQMAGAAVKAYVRTSACVGTFAMGTTNTNGQLDNPGLPYGRYDVCASKGSYATKITGVQLYGPNGNTIVSGRIRVYSTGSTGRGSCP